MLISIITPTFNRAHTLKKLYNSLIEQKFNNFEWILIDDGSSDHTKQLVEEWILENIINIKYFYKLNGGKSYAVHFGFSQLLSGKYSFVLDSDDFLSRDALTKIGFHLDKLTDEYIGLIGLKAYSNGNLVGGKFQDTKGTYIDVYFGRRATTGDKLFVIRTDVYINSVVLPIYGESFIPESLTFINANHFGVYRLINEVLYFGDYLADGLTKNARDLLLKNIKSHVFERRELLKQNMFLKYKIITTVYYIFFCLIAQMTLRQTLIYSGDKFLTSLLYLPTLAFLRITGKYHHTLK